MASVDVDIWPIDVIDIYLFCAKTTEFIENVAGNPDTEFIVQVVPSEDTAIDL